MFDKFKVKKPQRSTFSLSHKHETTVNIGDINCLHWNWCFPGDRFKIKYSFLAKFAPMIAPNFSRMRIKSEVFYVPLSDLYDNFHDTLMNYKEESSVEIVNGIKSTVYNYRFPYIRLDALSWWLSLTPSMYDESSETYFDAIGQQTVMQQYSVNRLVHQFGVPFDLTTKKIYSAEGVLVDNPYWSNKYTYGDAVESNGYTTTEFAYNGQVPISLFPFQAYQYVYNWYYRDSVRSSEVDCYPNVYVLTGNFMGQLVRGSGNSLSYQHWYEDNTSNFKQCNRFFNSLFQIRRRFYRKDYFNTAVGDPTVGVDSIAVPNNIVDLRKANQLQKFIEKQALAGNRVAEFIMAHWAYKTDSYEIGRPILISSSSQNVQISEVLQTSETTSDSAQGTRSGVGNSYGSSNGSYFVSPDYGILLINMSIVPEITYFSGTPRKLTPYRWEHFPWPEFSQIGMQPIYDFELSRTDNMEVATSPMTLESFSVFGYAPRYSEFKMELDQISGEMATSLRFWHQSPAFSGSRGISLNENFGVIGFRDYNSFHSLAQINEFFYFNQIFAVQDDRIVDHCQVVGLFDISVNRALPYNDMPAL